MKNIEHVTKKAVRVRENRGRKPTFPVRSRALKPRHVGFIFDQDRHTLPKYLQTEGTSSSTSMANSGFFTAATGYSCRFTSASAVSVSGSLAMSSTNCAPQSQPHRLASPPSSAKKNEAGQNRKKTRVHSGICQLREQSKRPVATQPRVWTKPVRPLSGGR